MTPLRIGFGVYGLAGGLLGKGLGMRVFRSGSMGLEIGVYRLWDLEFRDSGLWGLGTYIRDRSCAK